MIFITPSSNAQAAKDYYTRHLERSDYYMKDAQEMPGQWRGLGAELLGLQGEPKAGPATDAWVRQHGGRMLRCLPALDSDLSLLLNQLGLEFEFARPAEQSTA